MKKILLIEDNLDVRENTAEILTLANYTVITAKNGKEGVELAQKENPDLIICDIMMPVLDGYGVLHMLSKNENTASIPFIFLTAKSERSDFRKGMEMGADDYITKPFDDIELLNAIESRLKKSEILKKDITRNVDGLTEFLNNVDGLKALTHENDTRSYKKKETIYTEGQHPKGLFFLKKGRIKAYKTNEQGKELITGLYKEGDFFGYLALLEETKYSDSVAALEDVEVFSISKDTFFSLIHKNVAATHTFIKLISDNLQEKENQLLKLAYNSVRKRVSDALVILYTRYKKENEPKFTITVSREDIANLAGTATETTIRTLSDFKTEGLIDIKGGAITIINHDKLALMKN